MLININKAHFPVTVLGPGRRVGIWVQGCRIGCAGCVSQDTWDASVNRRMSVATLLAWCVQVSKGNLDGITISGGEPFDQPKALGALLQGLHHWRAQSGINFDILCYSGYSLTKLKKNHPAILDMLDALIPEPFIERQPTRQRWRGSDNQTLELLTDRARATYLPYLANQDTEHKSKQIQVMMDGKQVWYIGIPQRGDMQQLATRCDEQGLQFQQPSWRT